MKNRTFMEFMKDVNVRNEWVTYGRTLDLYIRKTPSTMRSKKGDLQLASMVNRNPGKGQLRRFLDIYEGSYQFFIENVLNPRLVVFFENRGYKKINNHIYENNPQYPPSFLSLDPKKEKKNGR